MPPILRTSKEKPEVDYDTSLPSPLANFPVLNLLSEELPPVQYLPRLSGLLSTASSSTPLLVASASSSGSDITPSPTTRIWFYREDLSSPLAFGGNKLRKLEYVIPRFLRPESGPAAATVLLTEGGIQSNHTRQTAAAAAALVLKCVVLLSKWSESEDPNYGSLGNVQLCRLLGADVRVLGKEEVEGENERVKEELEEKGEVVAWIPAGASLDERGGLGYARWIFELLDREEKVLSDGEGDKFDHVVVTCVSGSTLGGMVAGLKLAEKSGRLGKGRLNVLGVDASGKNMRVQRELVLGIARTTAGLLGLEGDDMPTMDDVCIDGRWNAGRYGHCDEATKEAMKLVARTEGVVADPVYTGKGIKGLIEGVKEGSLHGNVLFVHTGGQVALSVYGGLQFD